MLRNQLALSQFERLADMKELPQIEDFDDDDDREQTGTEQTKKSSLYDIEKNFDEQDMEYLNQTGYPSPNDFFDIDPKRLKEVYDDVIGDKKIIGNKIGGLKRTKNRTQEQEEELIHYTSQHDFFKKYKNMLELYFNTSHLKVGEGRVQRGQGIMYFSPQELLKRLELLSGSLAAGNNGVIPEYIQIAHRLRDLGIVTNNQLNTLLKKYLDIR